MTVFREMPISSADAVRMMEELNGVLFRMLGHNGTMHVHLEDFEQPRSVFLIGYEENEPVCCAGIRQVDADTGEVKRVYARRGSGTGAAMMAQLERWAVRNGYSRLILECRSGNPHAIGFYRRNGYAVCPNFPPYVGVEDAVCMEKMMNAE